MLVCFPGLRSCFRILFRFAPSNKLIAFVLNHIRLVVAKRRQAKEVIIKLTTPIQILHIFLGSCID
jgi:hypothetical protein